MTNMLVHLFTWYSLTRCLLISNSVVLSVSPWASSSSTLPTCSFKAWHSSRVAAILCMVEWLWCMEISVVPYFLWISFWFATSSCNWLLRESFCSCDKQLWMIMNFHTSQWSQTILHVQVHFGHHSMLWTVIKKFFLSTVVTLHPKI